MANLDSYVLRIRRGTEAQWAVANPILSDGEPGFIEDTNQYKIGDGVTRWNDLPYTTGPVGPQGPPGPAGQDGAPGQDGEITFISGDERYVNKVGDTMPGALTIQRDSASGHLVVDSPPSGSAQVRWTRNGDGAMVMEMTNTDVFRMRAIATGFGTSRTFLEARPDGTLVLNGNPVKLTTEPAADDDVATKKYVDDNAVIGGGGGGGDHADSDHGGLLPKASPSADGTTAALVPSSEWVGRWDINDDATPTAGWPDRLSFRFNGERTGWFNEYGELRVTGAKNSTIPLKVSAKSPSATNRILQVNDDQGGNEVFAVALDDQVVQITNRDRNANALIVNRTDPAQSTTDPDIVQVQYLSERRTWVNEKGMLRVGGVGAQVRDEDTFKIITDLNPGANAISVIRDGGDPVWRIGQLGRVNYYYGSRLVGDVIQFRDATQSDETTMGQETGGDLVINPANKISVGTVHGNLPLMPVWSGTQAQYDALTPDPNIFYAITP